MILRSRARKLIIETLALFPAAARRFAGGRAASAEAAAADSGGCPFAALGIGSGSGRDAVRAAYRAKCRAAHPDVGGSDAAFRRVQWAYEECLRRIESRGEGKTEDVEDGERKKGEGDGKNAAGDGTHQRSEEESYRQRGTHSWYKDQAELQRMQRQMFYGAFPTAGSAEEIDKLLFEALNSHCFDVIDVSEPLTLALKHYHSVTGYGAAHLEKSFQAIDHWETLTQRRAGTTFYHILLVLYTDGPKPGLTASIISESVEAVMEHMHSKGVEYDDWSLTLADKAFRISPYPTW